MANTIIILVITLKEVLKLPELHASLGHSKSNSWFTSRNGGDYDPGGWNIIINMYHVITMNNLLWLHNNYHNSDSYTKNNINTYPNHYTFLRFDTLLLAPQE